jgi:hypothetical protein
MTGLAERRVTMSEAIVTALAVAREHPDEVAAILAEHLDQPDQPEQP